MFGAAGGAAWSSLEEEAVVETVASSAPAVAVAVTGSTGSEFEIILPSSHFSFLPLFYFYFYFFIPLSLSLTRYLLSTSFISLFSLFWSTYSQSKQERPTLAEEFREIWNIGFFIFYFHFVSSPTSPRPKIL